jgi:hypothetical protein
VRPPGALHVLRALEQLDLDRLAGAELLLELPAPGAEEVGPRLDREVHGPTASSGKAPLQRSVA